MKPITDRSIASPFSQCIVDTSGDADTIIWLDRYYWQLVSLEEEERARINDDKHRNVSVKVRTNCDKFHTYSPTFLGWVWTGGKELINEHCHSSADFHFWSWRRNLNPCHLLLCVVSFLYRCKELQSKSRKTDWKIVLEDSSLVHFFIIDYPQVESSSIQQ
jgi:hypothetical protein